ncbi:hypothetical protein Efla_004566 [Eimeria flavescens]
MLKWHRGRQECSTWCVAEQLSSCALELLERNSQNEQQAARIADLEEELERARRLSVELEDRHRESMETLAQESKDKLRRCEQLEQSMQQRLLAVTAELNDAKLRAEQDPGRLTHLLDEKNQEIEWAELTCWLIPGYYRVMLTQFQPIALQASGAAAREEKLLQEISSLKVTNDEKVKTLSQQLAATQQELNRAESSAVKERKRASAAALKLQRVSEDLESQTAECQRLRQDLSAVEQKHRQLLQQIQRDRESFVASMHQHDAVEEENNQLRQQITDVVLSNVEPGRRLVIEDLHSRASLFELILK